MLDYAADASAATGRSARSLRRLLRRHPHLTSAAGSARSRQSPSFSVRRPLPTNKTFWAQVQTNILANRLRLLFVGDRFSAHLIRIIEYLNEQLLTTEVVGIEIVPHAGALRARSPTCRRYVARRRRCP